MLTDMFFGIGSMINNIIDIFDTSESFRLIYVFTYRVVQCINLHLNNTFITTRIR